MPAILHPNTAVPAPRLFALDVPAGWRVQRETRDLVALVPDAPAPGLVPTIVVVSGLAPAGVDLASLGASVLRRLARQGGDVEIEDGRIGTLSERRVYLRSFTATVPGGDVRLRRFVATWVVVDADAGATTDGPVDVFTVVATAPADAADALTIPFLHVAASVAVGPRLVVPPVRRHERS